MTQTLLADVSNQVQKFWAPNFVEDLQQDNILINYVNKSYSGEIKSQGDTVRVSSIVTPSGQNLTAGTDADTFSPEKLVTQKVDLVANKRAVASFEIEDLVELQSQIQKGDMKMRTALLQAVANNMNSYLYSLVNPSQSNPDHYLNNTAAITADIIANQRVLGGQAKWPKDGRWVALMDPKYWGDAMKDATLKSSDFVTDRPVVNGQTARSLYGFNAYEDNSLSTNGFGLFFHPDFMLLAMQTSVQIKISDLHAQKQFGYVISADIVYGATLGIAGNVKHTVVKAAA